MKTLFEATPQKFGRLHFFFNPHVTHFPLFHVCSSALLLSSVRNCDFNMENERKDVQLRERVHTLIPMTAQPWQLFIRPNMLKVE